MNQHTSKQPFSYCAWSETLPYDELRGRHLQAALAKSHVMPIVAVLPEQLGELPRTLRSLKDAHIDFGLWPMLENDQGRWLSNDNLEPFFEFCHRLLGICFDKGVKPRSFVLDVEPPLLQMRNWWKPGRKNTSKQIEGVVKSDRPIHALKHALHQVDVELHVAVLPLLALDNDRAIKGWESKLRAPDEWILADVVHVMAYTTLLKGYSKGFLSRKDALRILDMLCSSTGHRFSSRAAMSLGCVGQGALGDEAIYKTPNELAVDVGIAKSKGIKTLSVFDLGGMVRRGPIELWLDALTKTPPTTDRYEMNLKIHGVKKMADFLGKRFSS